MGFLRNLVSYVGDEIQGARMDLVMKANNSPTGILNKDLSAYDSKSSLVDPYGYHSISAFGFKEKYSILDYSKLRQISFADPIVAAVFQTRLNQVAAFAKPQIDKFKTGYKVVLKDREKSPTKAEKAKCRELEEFIMNCGVPETFDDTPETKKREKFPVFIRKVTRDSLSYDQLNFEITPRRNGMPHSFFAVDAATIRLVPDKKEQMESFRSNNVDGNMNSIYVSPYPIIETGKKEFKPKFPRYVQVINGIVRHTFDEHEMAFGIRNPRTDLLSYGYGFSELEMLVTIITSHMNAETYNRKFFTQGSGIKGVMGFEGSVPRDQLEAFRRQWHQQVSGVNNFWKTPIIAMGDGTKMQWLDFQKTNREMEFGKWLEYCIKAICFTPDTLVIMEDGTSKRIDEIEVGDKVITHIGRSQIVKNSQVSLYNDNLICLKIGSGSGILKVTPEHPFYIVSSEDTSWMAKNFSDPEWVKAKDIIAGRDYFIVPKRKFKNNKIIEEIDFENHLDGLDYTKNDNNELKLNANRSNVVPSKLPLNRDTAYVLGLYAAEGHAAIGGDLSWSFHIKEEAYVKVVNNFITDYLHLNPKFAQMVEKNCVQVRVGGKLVTTSFQSLFGRYSYERYIPNEIINSTAEVQKAFLSGVIAGDGSVWENNKNAIIVSIATSSKLFVNQLKSMLLSHGIWSGIYVYKKAKSFEKYDCKTMYDLRIHGKYAGIISEWLFGEKGDKLRNVLVGKNLTSTVHETPANFYIPVSEIWEEYYKGEVFNMEVDVDNSYLVEQCAVHNCGVMNIDPVEIGFDISRIGQGEKSGGGGLGDGNPMERVVQSQDKGLKPLLTFLAGLMNEYIISRIDPDFEFEFVGLNVNSEKDELALDERKVTHYQTINEIRAGHDMEPIPDLENVKSPGDLILNTDILNLWGSIAQRGHEQDMMEQEQSQEEKITKINQKTQEKQEETKKSLRLEL